MLYNYNSKFFLERFGQYLRKSKNGFPIVFSKSDLTGVGSNLLQKKNSGKAKHPKICLSLGGSMPEAQIKQCPLTPYPIMYLLDNVIQVALYGCGWVPVNTRMYIF